MSESSATPIGIPPFDQAARRARNHNGQDYYGKSDHDTRNRNRNPAESELSRQVAPDLRDYRRRVLQQEQYVAHLNTHQDKHSHSTVTKAL